MAGLILLGVIGLWIWGVFKFSRWVGRQVVGGRWRWPITALVFAALLPLPVIDEIVGGVQFRKLCRERAVLKVDQEKIRGRTVREQYAQSDLATGPISVLQSDHRFVDVSTGEELASYLWLRARGGLLARLLTESGNPLVIDNFECQPVFERRLEDTYQFNLIKN